MKSFAVVAGTVVARMLAAGMLAGIVGSAAAQQDYPNRPIRLIVPYPPGGGTDVIARVVTNRLAELLKQQVVIENRGGAGGVLGTEAVARSAPDGYTLLFATSAGLVINPLLNSGLSYDPVKDFEPVSLLVTSPLMLVINNSVPASSVRELIALAKSEPGKLNYASAGVGAPNHIGTELFKFMTGVEIVHVPYKGLGPGITDLLGGQVQVMFNPITGLTPYVKSGKVRALAVSTPQRTSLYPDLPTVIEAGVPGFEYELWYAVAAPAKTPPAIIARLNAGIARILAEPETLKTLITQGAEPRSTTPEGMAGVMRNDFDRLGKVIRAAGIKAE